MGDRTRDVTDTADDAAHEISGGRPGQESARPRRRAREGEDRYTVGSPADTTGAPMTDEPPQGDQ